MIYAAISLQNLSLPKTILNRRVTFFCAAMVILAVSRIFESQTEHLVDAELLGAYSR
jgi:hypothetical protein